LALSHGPSTEAPLPPKEELLWLIQTSDRQIGRS
jgi:hypothetical protein